MPATDVRHVNQKFYDGLWANVRLINPAKFNTWPHFKALADNAPHRLEVGAGMRPRMPIEGTCFADISGPALVQLSRSGGHTKVADVTQLPYEDDVFDLVCALDIVEHVEDDARAVSELCRVARPGATVLLSVPLHSNYWTTFDRVVGHYRRYDPTELETLLAENGLRVMRSAGFGMKPKSSAVSNWAMKHLEKNPDRALWWYNRVFMPLGLFFQKPLTLSEGLVDTRHIADVLLVCELAQA